MVANILLQEQITFLQLAISVHESTLLAVTSITHELGAACSMQAAPAASSCSARFRLPQTASETQTQQTCMRIHIREPRRLLFQQALQSHSNTGVVLSARSL